MGEPIYGKELEAVLAAVLETDDPVSNVKKARQVFSTGDAKSDYNSAINTVPNYKSLPLKERNRLSAERSRKRKLQKMDNLLQENMQLKEIVNQLKLENEQLLAQQQQNVEELDGDTHQMWMRSSRLSKSEASLKHEACRLQKGAGADFGYQLSIISRLCNSSFIERKAYD